MIEFVENFKWVDPQYLNSNDRAATSFIISYLDYETRWAPKSVGYLRTNESTNKTFQYPVIIQDFLTPRIETPQKKLGVSFTMFTPGGKTAEWFAGSLSGQCYIGFVSGTTQMFGVSISCNGSRIKFAFSNGVDGEDIEPITAYWHCGANSLHNISIVVDGDGAQNSEGQIIVAVDGQTIGTREGVVTMNYPLWGGDEFSSLAKFERLRIPPRNDAVGITDLVLFSGRAGYNDELLAIKEVATVYPDVDTAPFEANSSAYKNKALLSEEDRLLTTVQEVIAEQDGMRLDDDTDYVEASEVNVGDTLYYDTPLPRWNNNLTEIYGLVFSIWGKKVFDYDQDYSWSIAPTFVSSGNDLQIIPTKKTRMDTYTYKRLTQPYDLNPYRLEAWTWDDLRESAFGVRLVENYVNLFVEDTASNSDTATNE